MRTRLSSRYQVIRHLCRVEKTGIHIGTGLGENAAAGEARSYTELANGITRWRRYLDYLIGHYCDRKISRIETVLLQTLRMGLFELLILKRAPHATTNETVLLAKRLVRPGAGSLVNAVLRKAAQHPMPVPHTGDIAEDLGVRWSHPTWMVRRWLTRYGEDQTRALLMQNNARPVYSLRCNPMRTSHGTAAALLTEVGVSWKRSSYLDDFFSVQRLQPVIRAGYIEHGQFVVQGDSAGLAIQVLNPQSGMTLLDLCAAPGGKALYAAARMQNTGRVIAVDLHAKRLSRLERAAEQQGITIVESIVADSRTLDRAIKADCVLVDAPCSGLGVLAKRSDMRWKRTPDDLNRLTELQDALLDAATRFVNVAGSLVYATCTMEREENEDRISAFLARHPNYFVDRVEGPDALVTPEGYLAMLPHVHGVDGAFVARLRKRQVT